MKNTKKIITIAEELELRDIEGIADSFFVWIIFFVVNSIGALLRALPWWSVKVIYILLGIGFVYLGIMCMSWSI